MKWQLKRRPQVKPEKTFSISASQRSLEIFLNFFLLSKKTFLNANRIFEAKKKKVLQSESCDWHGIHSIVLKELKMYWVSKWFLWLAVFSLTVFFVSGLIGREWILILDMPLDLYLICFLLLLGESIEIIIKNKITGYVNKYNMLGESKDYKEAACLCWSVSEASTVIQTKE